MPQEHVLVGQSVMTMGVVVNGVIGPTADRSEALQGCYSFANHVLAQIPSPFHRLLKTTKEKTVAAAAAITLAALGSFSYLAGSQTRSPGDILSLQWWNNIFLQSFSMVTDTLRLLLTLVRLMMSVGLFVIEGLLFVLNALGRLVVFTPQGLTALFIVVSIFLVTLGLTSRHAHPLPLKPARPGRS